VAAILTAAASLAEDIPRLIAENLEAVLAAVNERRKK
jgi:hypothetical protein